MAGWAVGSCDQLPDQPSGSWAGETRGRTGAGAFSSPEGKAASRGFSAMVSCAPMVLPPMV